MLKLLSSRLFSALLICCFALSGLSSALARESYTSNPRPSVAASALPREAQATLGLIRRGGPFPYHRDGVIFQNREGRLPRRQNGYYHEYTVTTPGSYDRGARRIIAGAVQDYYYTDDHYRSFRLIRLDRQP